MTESFLLGNLLATYGRGLIARLYSSNLGIFAKKSDVSAFTKTFCNFAGAATILMLLYFSKSQQSEVGISMIVGAVITGSSLAVGWFLFYHANSISMSSSIFQNTSIILLVVILPLIDGVLGITDNTSIMSIVGVGLITFGLVYISYFRQKTKNKDTKHFLKGSFWMTVSGSSLVIYTITMKYELQVVKCDKDFLVMGMAIVAAIMIGAIAISKLGLKPFIKEISTNWELFIYLGGLTAAVFHMEAFMFSSSLSAALVIAIKRCAVILDVVTDGLLFIEDKKNCLPVISHGLLASVVVIIGVFVAYS